MNTAARSYSVAGTAMDAHGTTKVRFANDLHQRTKILERNGCTKIKLVELPRKMTKLAAAKYLAKEAKLTAKENKVVAAAITKRTKEKAVSKASTKVVH